MSKHSLSNDGTGYLSCPVPAVSGDWAISLWVKELNTSGSFIALMDDPTGVSYRLLFDFHGVNAGFCGGLMTNTGNLPDDDNWHSVILTRASGTLTFYVDGTSVDSGTHASSAAALTLHLGDNPSGGGTGWVGKYADVRLYNAALSGTDVTNLNAGTDVTANIVRHWALTEGTGTTAADTSGNAVDATLTGAGITWDTDLPAVLGGGGGGSPIIVNVIHKQARRRSYSY